MSRVGRAISYAAPFFVAPLLFLAGCGGGGSGESNSSTGNSITTETSTATAEANGATGVTLGWTTVSGANGYNLYRATKSNQLLTAMIKVNSSPVTYANQPYYDTSLTAATTYYYKISAVTGSSEVASPEVSATTLAATSLTKMGGSIQGNPLTLTGGISTVTSGLSTPNFITTDGTFIYLADQFTRSILKVTPATGAATVLLGNGGCIAAICSPRGLTTDGINIYITDESQGSIQKIVIASGATSTFITGLQMPNAITTDGTYLYIADSFGITKYNLTTNASSRLSTTPVLDLTTDGHTLYTINGNAIQKVDAVTGAINLFAGSVATLGQADGVGGLATFNFPRSITTDGTTLYVTQNNTNGKTPARRIDIATARVTTIPNVISGQGITTDGHSIYFVAGTQLNRLQ